MRFEAPHSIEEAVRILSAETGLTRILAGGTDVLVQLRSGIAEPDLIVDIKRIDAMHQITPEGDGFRIGAAVSSARLGEHEGVSALWPGVVEAASLIGSTQIQGRATVVGNLCNGSPAADSVPAMVAAGVTARVTGQSGTKEFAVEDIVTGPGQTNLGKGDIVESILLPARPAHSGDAYLRFIPRTEMDIAVVGSGVNLTIDADGICTAARVALGAVAARVLVCEGAADALVGSNLDEAALDAAAEAASAAASPINDKRGTVEFRKKVAGVLTKRAAAIALQRAKG